MSEGESVMKDTEKEEQEYSLSDEVLRRIVQIVQEGILLGIDVVDIMRLIRVKTTNTGALVLTDEYKKSVVEMHGKLIARAQELADLESRLIEPESDSN